MSASIAEVYESSSKQKQKWFSQTSWMLKTSLAQFRLLLQVTVILMVLLTLIVSQPLNNALGLWTMAFVLVCRRARRF